MQPHVAMVTMTEDHWEDARRIYAEGIATGLATFETDPPDCETWNTKHLATCRIVAKCGSEMAGWGRATSRCET